MSLSHIPTFSLPQGPSDSFHECSLASALYGCMSQYRPYFLETVHLDGAPVHDSMTLAQWSTPEAIGSLVSTYEAHIYRESPLTCESKPLKSLWAQWYIGLLVPPLMLALLTHDKALDITPERIHVQFHQTGRAARFHIDVQEDPRLSHLSLRERLETLWMSGIGPIIDALEASGDINGKLIWNNTGHLVNWFLGEMRDLLGDLQYHSLRHACFFERQCRSGHDNPLYRTVVPRDGLLVRRTCCQRNRLPGVQQCGDCTLK